MITINIDPVNFSSTNYYNADIIIGDKEYNATIIANYNNNLENSLDVQFIDDIEYPEGENEESIKELILNKFNEITED